MNGKQCSVLLYLHKQQDAVGQFVFMRSPLMTVYSEKFSSCKGADGVFICESEDGNNHLREMEDCSHDSWSRPNYEARGNTPSIVAARSLNAIKELIRDAVRNELQQDAQETEQVAGLDKILTISTPKGADDESQKDDIVDPDNILVKKQKPDLEKYESDNKKSGVKKGQTRSDDDRKKYIRDHWLISQNGLMRTSLMNLWWSVYLTVDESLGDEHKYDLTKIFFSNDGLRGFAGWQQSDIYSLAATLFFMLTGQNPPLYFLHNSQQKVRKTLAESCVSETTANAIMHAMQSQLNLCTKSARDFLMELPQDIVFDTLLNYNDHDYNRRR